MWWLSVGFSRLNLAVWLLLLTVVIGQQLECDFDAQTFCNWSNGLNGNEDDFDWKIGNQVQMDAYHSIPRTLTGTGYFAYAQGQFRATNSEASKAWLRSPVIESLSNSATLSFQYWKAAAPPVLQVCTRDVGQAQLRCLDTIGGLGAQSWVHRSVTIPSNPVPFQVILVASGFRSGLDTLAVDDLSFNGVGSSKPPGAAQIDPNLMMYRTTPPPTSFYAVNPDLNGLRPPETSGVFPFGLSNRRLPVLAPFRPIPSGLIGNTCPAVSCTFDQDLCEWQNDLKANYDWRIRNLNSRSSDLPLPLESARISYVWVSGERRKWDQRASLRSGQFVVPPGGVLLEFFAVITDVNSGRLRLYREEPSGADLLWQAVGSSTLGSGWQRVRVPLQTSSGPIFVSFVADSLAGSDQIAIDDVRLTDPSGQEISCDSIGADSTWWTSRPHSTEFFPQPTARQQLANLRQTEGFSWTPSIRNPSAFPFARDEVAVGERLEPATLLTVRPKNLQFWTDLLRLFGGKK